jgi:hypothetical protein
MSVTLKVFVPKKEVMRVEKLCNVKLYNFYILLNIIRLITKED